MYSVKIDSKDRPHPSRDLECTRGSSAPRGRYSKCTCSSLSFDAFGSHLGSLFDDRFGTFDSPYSAVAVKTATRMR